MNRAQATLSIVGVIAIVGCGSDGGPSPSALAAAPSTAPVAATSSPATPAVSPSPAASPSEAASPEASAAPASILDLPIEPANFVAVIDNPWFPLIPGTTFRYRGIADGEPTTDVVEVTHDTKVVDGITTTVIKDTVRVRGVVEEVTEDWYAQDVAGNVWYFGEATAELDRKGRVTSTSGSWAAGVDGALPGVYMPAEPGVGQSFPQEQFPGAAEDWFVVMFSGMRVKTPAATYRGAMVTGEWTPLEPGIVGEKWYAKGVGQVMENDISGGQETLRLVRVTGP
jgi:hypothetical protein